MLLSVRSVALLLGVTADTVRAYVKRGQLKALRLPGGSYRIREEEVAAFSEAVQDGEQPMPAPNLRN